MKSIGLRPLVIASLFAIIGVVLLVQIFAASGQVSVEPDSEALLKTDETAFNEDFIEFGTQGEPEPFNPEANVEHTLPNGQIVRLPEGFTITEFANSLNAPRHLEFTDDGTLIVGSKEDNVSVFALQDTDNDGVADERTAVDTGLNVPHSVHVHDGDLYIATETQIIVHRDIQADGSAASREVLVPDIPDGSAFSGPGHRTRTIVVGPDDKIYLTLGSSCNVCEEPDPRRASMLRFDLDGSNEEIFATGLRNTIDFMFFEDKIYGVDTGRDMIGDDEPPEEINIIEEGKRYGWPKCHGDGITSPEYPGATDYCQNDTEFPFIKMQAHSTPTSIRMMNDAARSKWPNQLDTAAFMVFRGSWNRSVPTGYKVVWTDLKAENPVITDFLTGWLVGNDSWGRPVGLTFSPDGDMYVSDDTDDRIYKISYDVETTN